jgi:hypothetical protein
MYSLDVFNASNAGRLPRYGTHQNHYPGFDKFDLRRQVGRAGFNLIGKRLAVAWRRMFHDVGYEEPLTFDEILGENLIEEFTRSADERLSHFVFLSSGVLSHQHQLCIDWSLARHCLFCTLPKSTFFAACHLFMQFFEAQEIPLQ